MTDAPSKSQVDKAGARLRRWLEGGTDEDLETPEMEQAMRVLVAWRAGVFGPLASVMSGVTVAMERGGVRGRLTSRPKRYGRIIEKLGRLHRMRLSQMEDIGGCRVVLDTLEEVHRLRDHLLAAWPDAQTDDYIAFPKHTGYRAIHIVVVESGRMIEIQLRTFRQNEWADAVERTGDRLDLALKDGEGPAELLEYFRQASERIAIEEGGGTVQADQEDAFSVLRERVRPYFRRTDA